MKTTTLLALLTFAIGCGSTNDGGHGSDGGSPGDGGGGSPDLTGGPERDMAHGPTCVPSCAGKTCGDDGCCGVCGTCGPTELCSAGACVAPSGNAALNVDPTAGAHAIHPEIYGLAFADAKTLKALNIPINRWGGDNTSLYNWQLDVSNHDFSWYFENIPNDGASGTYGASNWSSSSDEFIKANQGAGAATLMTIPTIGWTPKDRITSHPYSCGFPTEKYGAQQSTDPYDTHCGNGVDPSGKPLTPDPTNDSMASTPAFEGQWVAHLVSRFGAASAGGVQYYQLDNEMMLWDSTHRDVRSTPVSSDDVWNATANYAPVIKNADSSAYVLGYTAWSILDLMESGLDTANQNTNDQMAHDGIPLAQWYLRQLAAYEKAHGTRLVDCLDAHYYPMGGDGLDNTRSLWDATYHDPSWVDGFLNAPIQLIPRMQQWIAQEYPGTDVCISEYNFHNDDPTNAEAGLVEADVLGIFGKYGVRLANFWTTPVDGSGNPYPSYRAFQMFRNYDGAGGAFGDVSIGATSSLAKVAIYAASDSASAPTTLTVIIINKDTSAQSTTLGIANFSAGASAHVWQVVNNAAPSKQADAAIAAGQLAITLPASSITMVVIPKQ